MTGPEHYSEAEYMLQMATNQLAGDDGIDDANRLIARAQVHATLALAAATIFDTSRDSTSNDWCVVTGTVRGAPQGLLP